MTTSQQAVFELAKEEKPTLTSQGQELVVAFLFLFLF